MDARFQTPLIVVHAVFGSAVLFLVLVFAGVIPPSGSETSLFLPLACVAAMLLPIAFVLGGRIFGVEAVEARFREGGATAAIGVVMSGSILGAAIGEASAIFGFVYYLLSGDTLRTIVFFALVPFHYVHVLSRFLAARAAIERLEQAG